MYWLIAILFAATSPVLNLYHDGFIDQRWSMTAIVALIGILYILLSRKRVEPESSAMASASLVITLYLCSHALLSYLLKGHALVGPFENPNVLSLHLCMLLPFILEGARAEDGTIRVPYAIVGTTSAFFIILTDCRTGWICLATLILLVVLKGRWRLSAVPVALVLGLVFAVSVKLPSSRGRSFIMRNSAELIAEAPLLGHGADGFGRLYMPKQAEYFRTHHDKDLEMLADDIRHPLNEFLLAGVNHGLAGILLLAVLMLFPLIWKRKLYEQCRAMWQSMCMLLIFCLFCYPLLYPMSWLLTLSSWALLFKERLVLLVLSHRSWPIIFTSMSLLLVAGYTILLLDWGYASRKSKHGHSAEMMPRYERLYPYLSWRSIFLYDYAIESLYADRYGQAYRLAEECRRQHLSYDLALLEGDICRYLKHYDRALACYDEASLMCPVRFAPPYGKWQVYKATHDVEREDSMVQVIKQKEIKVYSPEIQNILKEIK